ncbi:Afadin [Manis javanica]|nr:Afadin [Manis javanica]
MSAGGRHEEQRKLVDIHHWNASRPDLFETSQHIEFLRCQTSKTTLADGTRPFHSHLQPGSGTPKRTLHSCIWPCHCLQSEQGNGLFLQR